eukprot:gene40641-50279_t
MPPVAWQSQRHSGPGMAQRQFQRGLAGLSAALHLAPTHRVAVITKRTLQDGSSGWAQGGIAAVLADDDSFAAHIEDTLVAGAGLCDLATTRFVVENAPASIAWLRELGVPFTLEGDQLHLTREGGHSARRIACAGQGGGRCRWRYAGYRMVWRHPYFQRLAPLAFCVYGGMVAVQTLWAGPWMQQVAGYTPLQAATGLFWINVSMLCTFWSWGMLSPWLLRRGWDANRLMLWGLPLSLLVLLCTVLAGPRAGGAAWALFCMASSFVSLS